jgi:predicted amidohydrolase YtcJ
VHCVGAATLVAALDAFARCPRATVAAGATVWSISAECPPPLVARIAALGLTVVTNPAFVYWRGDVYRARPRRRAAWLYRAGSLVAAGVAVAAASDAPVVGAEPVARHAPRARGDARRRDVSAARARRCRRRRSRSCDDEAPRRAARRPARAARARRPADSSS